MEDIRAIYRQLLGSDGIDQQQRLLSALQNGYVQLEDRGIARQINILYSLSKELRFFNPDLGAGGDWSALFKRFLNDAPPPELIADEAIEHDIANSKDVEPSLALLIVFLKLLEHVKTSLNKITAKHLTFYYQDVLGFKFRAGSLDKVHVLFELTKNADPLLIEAGTLLDAGKTADGKALQYKTTSEIVVNLAKIAAIRSLFVEKYSIENTSKLWLASYDPKQMPETIFPFGGPQSKLPASGRNMKYAVTGMAIASSLLDLEGGERKVTISLESEAFADPAPAEVDLKNYVQIDLTGDKGWIVPQVHKAVIIRKAATGPDKNIGIITIVLLLTEALPPVSVHNEQIHKGGFTDGTPVFRMVTISERSIPDFLQKFRLASAFIEVGVKGLKKVIVQNEDGLQLANKPFNMFGSLPAIGDHFYIGSKECFQKNVKQLTIHLKWKAPPADFVKYYAGYRPPSTFSSAVFGASLDLLLNGTFTGHPLADYVPLFNAQEKDYPLNLTITRDILKKANNSQDLPGVQGLPDLSEGFQPGVERGFVRFTLISPDFENFTAFGHRNFANALTIATLDMIRFPDAGIELPLPPYTPQVKEISIDYKASDTVFPGNNDRVYHQTPFGVELLKNKGASLFPEYVDTGYLYIGITDLKPGQQVNLLFGLAEKSSVEFEGYDSDFSTPVISWAYLSDDNWVEFRQDQIPIDTTKQLQQTGIISLSTGADATSANRSFTPAMIWLQATLKQGLNRVLPLSTIDIQAVEAILDILPGQRLEDFAEHLSSGLSSDKIKNNAQISSSLKLIRQPYSSFGGVPPESSDHFIIRLSERLRHRKRAVHAWDFERLGLEAFPEIAKIKCLSANSLSAPGTAQVIIIPKMNLNLALFKRLQPKASSFFLDQVGQFLTSHCSFFTTVAVNNPDYEEILADFKVKFNTGFDPVFYLGKLNQDIIRFISPWAFNEKIALHFEAEIYRSEIMYFIEKLPYVNYIADFKLFHLNGVPVNSKDVIGKMKIAKTFIVHKTFVPSIGTMKIGENFIVGIDWEIIIPTRDSAILVSVTQHNIKTVDDQRVCSGISALGIGSMVIGFDFIVSSN